MGISRQEYWSGLPFPSPSYSPGKNTGVGCHFLLHGIFLTQGSNPCLLNLLHCRWILYPLSPRYLPCYQFHDGDVSWYVILPRMPSPTVAASLVRAASLSLLHLCVPGIIRMSGSCFHSCAIPLALFRAYDNFHLFLSAFISIQLN